MRRKNDHPLASTARLRPAGPAVERRTEPRPKRAAPGTRQRVTVKLPTEVIERARDAVLATPGLTLAALVERGVTAYVDRLEKRRGSAFPPRRDELPVGRPRRVK
jgi:hypothetical protein